MHTLTVASFLNITPLSTLLICLVTAVPSDGPPVIFMVSLTSMYVSLSSPKL